MPKKSRKTRQLVVPDQPNNLSPHFFKLIAITLVGIAFAQIFFFRSTIRIGLNLELTGEHSPIGQASLNGAQLAIDQLNSQGGIQHNGKKYTIELIAENNNSEEQLATDLIAQLKQKKVHAIVGPNVSELAIPAANEVETQQLLMVSPRSTDSGTTFGKSLVFQTAYTDQIQMQALVKYVNFDLKATRVAILYDNSNQVFQNQANYFRSEFQSWGGEVVAFNALPTDEATLIPQLNALKALNPHVIFLPAYGDQAISIISKAREMGITSEFLGSDAWEPQHMVNNCGEACNGSYVSTHFSTQTDSEKVRQFVNEYQTQFNQAPTDVAALTYDSVQLLATAMSQSEDLAPHTLAATLQSLQNFEGLTGNISYSTTAHDPFKSVQILKLENGQANWVKTVYP